MPKKQKLPGRPVPHHGSGPDNYAPDHTAGRAIAHARAETLARFSMNLPRATLADPKQEK